MPDIRLHDYVTKIKGLIQDDRHDEAIVHCQHILSHYPKHIEAYCLLGEACLEKGMYREAIEFFQRTLSANPESFIARVGLGIIYDEQGSLAEAIWQMERAFELAPGNAEVRRELQRLYAQRDGAEKTRLKLTRGALGWLYSRNGLYERAISEFHGVLSEDPDLPDIQVALVEALWREGRRLEAVETCLALLDALPYCLKANLILGEIWTMGGHEEAGEEKLQLAQALDPENRVAQEMMGKESPLPPREVLIPELETIPDTLSLIPMGKEFSAEWETPGPEPAETEDADFAEEEELGELPARLEEGVAISEEEVIAEQALMLAGAVEDETPSEDEIPDWLQELVGDDVSLSAEEVVPASTEPGGEFAEQVPGEVRTVEAGDAPGIDEQEPLGQEGEEEEAVEWEEEIALGGPPDLEAPAGVPEEEAFVAPQEQVPESLRALVEAGILDESDLEAAMAEMSEEEVEAQRAEEVPEWLRDLLGEGALVAGVALATSLEEDAGEPPAEVPTTVGEAVSEEEEVEELPDWLREREAPEEEEVAAPSAPVEEGAVLPPQAEVPESLLALVEAGILDESDLETAMAEMSEEQVEAQRAEEVPEWLRDLLAEEGPAAGVALAPPLDEQAIEPPAEKRAPVAEEEEIEELPDWLQELEAPEAETAPVAGEETMAPEEAVQELPDWLQELETPDAETAQAAGEEAMVLEEEEVDDLPDWLQELETPDAEMERAAGEEAMVLEEETVEDLPDWLKEMAGSEAVTAEEAWAEEDTSAEDVAPEVEAAAPPEEDVPESLQSLVEEGVLDEAGMVVAMAAIHEEGREAPSDEEIPGWLRDVLDEEGLADERAPAPALEEEAIEPPWEEQVPDEVLAREVSEAEPPAPEPEELAIEPTAAAEAEEIAPAAEEEILEEGLVLEETVLEPPPRGVEEAEVPVEEEEVEPVEAIPGTPPAEAAPPSDVEMVAPYDRVEVEEEMPARRRIEDLGQQLKANPRDHALRLELARLYRMQRDWGPALTHYQNLISARKFLPFVLEDLGLMLQDVEDRPRVYQLMGDAYLQESKLDKALQMYQQAQKALTKR